MSLPNLDLPFEVALALVHSRFPRLALVVFSGPFALGFFGEFIEKLIVLRLGFLDFFLHFSTCLAAFSHALAMRNACSA